jgi:hypothetical protein
VGARRLKVLLLVLGGLASVGLGACAGAENRPKSTTASTLGLVTATVPLGRSTTSITPVQSSTAKVTTSRPVGAPGVYHHQEDNSYFAYTGFWTQSVMPKEGDGLEADGEFFFAPTTASVTVRFKGTYIGYIAKKAYYYGMARVTLDDRAPVLVDLYRGIPEWQQTVWNSGTLPLGVHTLKLDALDIVGELQGGY